jgi:predicted ATP-grasp superfamily ATP-dependent carboligase
MKLFLYEHLSAGGLGGAAPASLLREGRTMLAAVAADFARVPGVAVTTLLADGLPALPSVRCVRDRATFLDLAGEADATLLIAPEFDGILESLSRAVLAAGGTLIGSSPEAVALTADKWRTFQHWQRRGVPTPATALTCDEATFPPPWVVKPRDGAGSQETFFVERRDDAIRGIVQPFVPGTPASVAFLVGPGQTLPLLPATQTLSRDGRFSYEGGVVPLDAALHDRAQKLALRAIAGIDGLRGYVGVDLVLGDSHDGSGDVAIEINPRVTTSYLGLQQMCASNLADTWLRTLRGDDVRLTWRAGRVRFAADGTWACAD